MRAFCRLLAAALLLLPVAVPAQDMAQLPGRLRWVPNPTRMSPDATGSTGWVSDPAGHLAKATVAAIDSTIYALEQETGHEMAVAVLDSLDGLEPDQAALLLHRRWGVGKRDRNNGIVFLWSPAQRKLHVSVGYRLEGVLPDARTGRILDEHVLPRFREQQFDAGVLAGVRALAAAAREEGATAVGVPAYHPAVGDDVLEPEPWSPGGVWFSRVLAALAIAAAGLLGFSVWRRRRPRKCPTCRQAMMRLDEEADDARLSREERLEESLRSVNYDIWVCAPCGQQLIVPVVSWFSGYDRCGSCRRHTAWVTTRTLRAATSSSEGLEEVTTSCRNCQAHDVRQRTTPRVRPRSGSSRGGSGSHGGGGTSSGRSSSFGGGSAGGGGAGRRY